jgi:hypothetical protein
MQRFRCIDVVPPFAALCCSLLLRKGKKRATLPDVTSPMRFKPESKLLPRPANPIVKTEELHAGHD